MIAVILITSSYISYFITDKVTVKYVFASVPQKSKQNLNQPCLTKTDIIG